MFLFHFLFALYSHECWLAKDIIFTVFNPEFIKGFHHDANNFAKLSG